MLFIILVMTLRRGRKRFATIEVDYPQRRKRRRTTLLGRGSHMWIGAIPEVKFVDVEVDSDAFALTWATMEDATNDSIAGVAQGDGESQRDGRKYFIHSIHIRCSMRKANEESSNSPKNDIKGRICLVWDTQTNGAQLVATDVMDGGLTDDTLAFRNLQHTKRFRVIWDKSFVIKLTGQTNEGAANLFANGITTTPIYRFNKHFKKPVPVICSLTTAVVAAISDNSFHIIGVASETNALLNMQVRVRFTR